jgi:hypothetical protein
VSAHYPVGNCAYPLDLCSCSDFDQQKFDEAEVDRFVEAIRKAGTPLCSKPKDECQKTVLQLQAQVSLLQEAVRLYETQVMPYASSWFNVRGWAWPHDEAAWERVRPTIEEAFHGKAKE